MTIDNPNPAIEEMSPPWCENQNITIPTVIIVGSELQDALGIPVSGANNEPQDQPGSEKKYNHGEYVSLSGYHIDCREGKSLTLAEIIDMDDTLILGHFGNPGGVMIVPPPHLEASCIVTKPVSLWSEREIEHFQQECEFPIHAIKQIPISRRGVEEEMLGFNDEDYRRNCSAGPEIELVIRTQDGRCVDASELVDWLSVELGLPVTPEGLTTQIEFNPNPFTGETTRVDYVQVQLDRLKVLVYVCDKLGLTVCPEGLIGEGESEGTSNMHSEHVERLRYSLVKQGEEPMSKEDLIAVLEEISCASGTHVSAELAKPEDGLLSDERLRRVSELCMSDVSVALRLLTLNGNYASVEGINSVFSKRREVFSRFPTAKTPTLLNSRFGENVHAELPLGHASFLERAVHASYNEETGEMHFGKGYHNPLVRAKDRGLVEFVGCDSEGNIDKVIAIMAFWKMYIDVVDTSILRSGNYDSREEVPSMLTDYYQKAVQEGKFKEYSDVGLFNPKNFVSPSGMSLDAEQKVSNIDTNGKLAMMTLETGHTVNAEEYVGIMLKWVEVMYNYLIEDGIKSENNDFVSCIGDLQHMLNGVAPNFVEYFDKGGEFYGKGSIAEIFRNRFNQLVNDDRNRRGSSLQNDVDLDRIRIKVRNEYSQAWREYILRRGRVPNEHV